MSRSDGSTADYYVLPEGATQLQDLISHRNMNAQIGEITRACYRYGMASHSDMLRDAKKIRFYAQSEVERLEKLTQAEEPSHIISDIWLNAPTEATHYSPEDEDHYEVYWKKDGERFTDCWVMPNFEHHHTEGGYKPETDNMQPRPTSTAQ